MKLKHFTNALITGLSLFTLTGCITNPNISRDLTSSQIGCTPSQIKITNETARIGGLHNWVAECKGQKFVCSYNTTQGTKCVKPL